MVFGYEEKPRFLGSFRTKLHEFQKVIKQPLILPWGVIDGKPEIVAPNIYKDQGVHGCGDLELGQLCYHIFGKICFILESIIDCGKGLT